ncbi:unnamed protein product [Schistosoma rodhaini]|nr:unnamed protein product [Schistosoma rodhaini]
MGYSGDYLKCYPSQLSKNGAISDKECTSISKAYKAHGFRKGTTDFAQGLSISPNNLSGVRSHEEGLR